MTFVEKCCLVSMLNVILFSITEANILAVVWMVLASAVFVFSGETK